MSCSVYNLHFHVLHGCMNKLFPASLAPTHLCEQTNIQQACFLSFQTLYSSHIFPYIWAEIKPASNCWNSATGELSKTLALAPHATCWQPEQCSGESSLFCLRIPEHILLTILLSPRFQSKSNHHSHF